MFDKLKSFFTSSGNVEEEPLLEPQEEPKEEKKELPDQLEVEWNDIVYLKNLEIATRKAHEKLKEVLYSAKLVEYSLTTRLDAIKEVQKEKLIELHEKYGVPQDGSYDVELPETTGRSGFFKKVGK
jgi:hypothetical protein